MIPGESEALDHGPGEVHLAEYWAVILRRRRLIVPIVAVSVLGALLLSLLTRPTYRATVVLDVEPERWTPLDIGDKPYIMGADTESIPTQIQMMTGREVAERVVTQLGLVDNPEMNPPVSGLVQRAAPVDRDGATTRLALKIQRNATAAPVRGTKLVRLSYVATSPKLAADVANALANAYLDWLLETRYRALGHASKFLATQIEQLRSETAEKERHLEEFGRQKDIVSVDPQTNVTLQKLESLTKDYTAAVSDRVAKQARYEELRTSSAAVLADSVSDEPIRELRAEQARLEQRYADQVHQFKPEWPAMQQLKAQIDRGRQRIAALVAEAVSKAREGARSDYLTAQRREESLKSILQTQKAEAMSLNSNAIEYNNLRVEVQTKRTLFDTLLRRQAETALSARMSGEKESNIRIVESALPGSRFTPSYQKNLLGGLGLGLGFGIALAFFLEYMDRSLRSAEQVEQFLKLPTLGIIPDIHEPMGKGYGYGYGYGQALRTRYGRRSRKGAVPGAAAPPETAAIELLPHTMPRSSAAESYRALRTALLLSRPGGVKSMVLASAFPGEGKTATAVNLAVVLGQLPGKGVLLVDADLHKPRLHEVFGVSNRVGLVSVLAQNLAASNAIVKTTVPGVFLLPAGPISPNPSGLLASQVMRDLLKLAAMTFEYVVVDAPPVFPVSDALVLGTETDGVIICAKGGATPREHVVRLRDTLTQSNVPILGVVLNRLAERTHPYGRHYFEYYEESAYGSEAGNKRASGAATGA